VPVDAVAPVAVVFDPVTPVVGEPPVVVAPVTEALPPLPPEPPASLSEHAAVERARADRRRRVRMVVDP
jgi:hypothetical protein